MVKKKPDLSPEGDIPKSTGEETPHVRVEATVELPPGAEVRLTIHYRPDEETAFRSKVVNLSGGDDTTRQHFSFNFDLLKSSVLSTDRFVFLWKRFSSLPDFQLYLFLLALFVYYALRLIRLADFPIFFFTDEAVHTMLAADLIRNGFTGSGGEFLPTFFKSGETFNAGFPVYLQVLPELIGIRSVFMTRLVSVTASLLAAAGLGLIYARVHNARRAWLAVLLFSILPAWFYHSRTAFETVIAVSFFTVFLLGYINYRTGDQRWIYVSVVTAALAFYSYSPARVVVGVMLVLLLIFDFRYHWENRRKLWKPLLLGLALCLPYVRFLYLHPGENQHHLQLLRSYWAKDESVLWKLLQLGKTYLQGLNPYYWFIPNSYDLDRHIMKGMGHLGWYFSPFFLAGLVIAARRWKNPGYRVMILALLAAPSGAAFAEIGITRALFMVIPAAFFITIGFDYLIDWLQHRFSIRRSIDLVIYTLLIVVNFGFLDAVLTRGPLWFTNYGMNGLQYGAEKVFRRVQEIYDANPDVPIVMSPNWANGTNVLARFFLGDPVPIEMDSMSAFIDEYKPFPENTLFIMPPDELNNVINSGKFDPLQIKDVILSPDGKPAFVFANMKYNQFARDQFELERNTRVVLTTSPELINGDTAFIASSQLDMGDLAKMVDNDPATLIRSKEANPLIVEIEFTKPRVYHTISMRIGGPATKLSVYVIPAASDDILTFSKTVLEAPEVRNITMAIPTDKPINRMRIEVRSIRDQEPAHIHLWDVGLE